MLFTSYQAISNIDLPVNSGSYLSSADNALLGYSSYGSNIWYGKSKSDIIELSIWDLNSELIGWGTITGSNDTTTTNSYLNALNYPSKFSSSIINPEFILYKNSNILINPDDDLASIGYYNTGSYYLIYNMIRNMAGSQSLPLVIKEISPSRTEVKLLPQGVVTQDFINFYSNQVFISDIYQEYINNLITFPVSIIYNSIKLEYSSAISILQSVSFLNTDAAIINFITNIYEDSYSTSINYEPATRVQGIKSYFFNYLMENKTTSINFKNLDVIFDGFVTSVVDERFQKISRNTNSEYYKLARQFVYDLIKIYYYQPISDKLTAEYNNTYNSPLKNGLNLGLNQLYPILNQGAFYEDDGSVSLIIKLKDALPQDLSVGLVCWISNLALSPVILSVSINDNIIQDTYNIGPPNFTIKDENILSSTGNKKYCRNDIIPSTQDTRNISISKKIKELNIDYTNFKDFILFSSAEIRLKIFKNKNLQLDSLNSQISTLNVTNQNYITSKNSTYPFYNSELSNINAQIDVIINSFDGYESYLSNSNIYEVVSGSFSNTSQIQILEESASIYDSTNSDSLIKNTPKYILEDPNNDDYIIFLSMVGHFFDNIFIYISNLPSAKLGGLNIDEMLSNKMVSSILEEMGWSMDDMLSDDNISNYNLPSPYSAISPDERIRIIENRILKNLPLIYKSKGTRASVDLLLSCYGIPSSLLNIREYGGYTHSSTGSYDFYERAYLYTWNSKFPNDMFTLDGINNAKSYMFKVSFNDPLYYAKADDNILIGAVNQTSPGIYPMSSSLSGSGEWAIGFTRTNTNNSGTIYFRIGYDGNEVFKLESSEFSLFDGNVYSILLRKNDIDPEFDVLDFSGSYNQLPRQYDLVIQRNNSGDTLLETSQSYINYDEYTNSVFDGIPNDTRIVIGGWFLPWNSRPLVGSFDKLEIFNNVISNETFQDYVNNINSYSSGMTASYNALLFRMGVDYPFDITTTSAWPNSNTVYSTYLSSSNAWTGAVSESYNTSSCQTSSISIYPYQFTEIEYLNTINTSYYGPNKFQNNKINNIEQEVSCRLDNLKTSTTNIETLSPSSNLLGIFVDPQDFKNKDIIRQFGSYDLMTTLGDPSLAYCNQYQTLKPLRALYVNSKKTQLQNTLFSELMIVYRLYFNKSIFETIKKLLPARANVFSGILIEPTILERSKYQFKPITSSLNIGDVLFEEVGLTDGLFGISSSVEYMEQDGYNLNNFKTELMSNEKITTSYPIDGYVPYSVDDIQLEAYINPKSHKISNGYCPHSSSVYALKRWKKYKYSSTIDTHLDYSASTYLYDYVTLPKNEFYNLIYSASSTNNVPVLNSGAGPWTHYPNTFKSSSNSITNNTVPVPAQVGNLILYTASVQETNGEYFEIVGGYPRNHYSHKRNIFSNYISSNANLSTTYKKSEIDFFPAVYYNRTIAPGQYYVYKGTSYPITDSNIIFVKNKYYIKIGKKNFHLKTVNFISSSFNPSSSFYTVISSSVDINTLLYSENPVYVLVQDAIGVLG